MYPEPINTQEDSSATANVTISKNSIVKDFYIQLSALEDEKRGAQDAIKEKLLEAKSAGVDPKILKAVHKLAQETKAQRDEKAALLELYMTAIGVE
jgi:uncharacterized protein (UPF0335 family)